MLNGSPCGAKKLKTAHQIFQNIRIFKFVPSPTDHRGHIGKVLHVCTTAFLPLYKSIKSCIKFLKYLSDMVRTKWPLSLAFLHRTLTNYSAAMKSVIRKISYKCTSTITVLIGELVERAKKLCHSNFPWPNSKTNVAPSCGIVQMSFQTFERAFLPLIIKES